MQMQEQKKEYHLGVDKPEAYKWSKNLHRNNICAVAIGGAFLLTALILAIVVIGSFQLNLSQYQNAWEQVYGPRAAWTSTDYNIIYQKWLEQNNNFYGPNYSLMNICTVIGVCVGCLAFIITTIIDMVYSSMMIHYTDTPRNESSLKTILGISATQFILCFLIFIGYGICYAYSYTHKDIDTQYVTLVMAAAGALILWLQIPVTCCGFWQFKEIHNLHKIQEEKFR